MKKPFTYALGAAVYIALIVSVINFVTSTILGELGPSILIPMTMLSLFVLSAAIMGFLFLSEPLQLYLDGKKQEALIFFGKTVGYFACFVLLFAISILLV